MDLLKSLGISRQSGQGSPEYSGLGDDSRWLLRQRSGEIRRSGVVVFAWVCSAVNEDDTFGFSSRTQWILAA